MLPSDFVTDSAFWTAVIPIFDGSTISDPVVVSNVFWANIQSKVVAIIIAQLVATVFFSLLSALLAPQVAKWGDSFANFLREKNKSKNQGDVDRTKPITIRKKSLRSIQPDFGKLLICIAVDILGSSSELVPIMGEATDIIWAPLAGFILRSLYGSNILFALEFLEEILPFTDVLPLATITWVVDTLFADSSVAQILQVGIFNPRINGATSFTTGPERLQNIEEQRLLPGNKDAEER